MHRRIRAEYIPRSGSEWGELAGSSLSVYRLHSIVERSIALNALVTKFAWVYSHSVNLEKMEG